MQPERISEFKTGRLLPIQSWRGNDWAFVPDNLPSDWAMPERLWPLVVEARAVLGRFDGIAATLPSPRLLLRPLQRREALRSSSLEGTYVKPQELLLFEAEGKKDPGGSPRTADWVEVFNYDRAMRLGERRIRNGAPLNGALILALHRVLLEDVRGEDRSPGQFRQKQVHVGTDRRYNPPPPEEIPRCLANLEQYLLSEDQPDPLLRAFIAHYQFEAIHPFLDGNGRIGRVVLSLTVYKWLGLSRPWLYLSEFFERHRDDYVTRLFRVSTHGEWEEWVEFCLKGTIEQTLTSIKRCNELRALRRKYLATPGAQGPRMSRIIERLFSSPLLRIVDVKNDFSVSYATAKADVRKLVEEGILDVLPDTYPKAFIAPRIVEIAYVD
ncbi:MAG: Fic family protein [Phycisphaerae bacterium]|jgi:Fic family protein